MPAFSLKQSENKTAPKDPRRKQKIVLFCLLGAVCFFALSRCYIAISFLGLFIAALLLACAAVVLLFYPWKRKCLLKLCRVGRWLALGVFLVFAVSFIILEAQIIADSSGSMDSDSDYLLVLGAGLMGEIPSAPLASRLNVAELYMKEHPDCVAVLSGGQGPRENISEALAMSRYLQARGIDQTRLYLEDKSTSTKENFLFSLPILQEISGETSPNIVVISNEFHLHRVGLIAAELGLSASTIPAPTPKILLLPINNYLREYFALVLYLTRSALT